MRSTHKTKNLIKKLHLDVYTNSEADQSILGELLQAQEKSHKTEPLSASLRIRRHKMSGRNRAWKVAAVIALICTGVAAAAVVGAKIYRWHVESKHPEYGYMLRSEDGNKVTNIPESWADSPEHAVKVKEELDLLQQQDKRKLVGVSEYEVNGQLDHRWLSYEYTLSDGQVIRKGENDPDEDTPRILVGERRDEAERRYHEILKLESATMTTDPQTGDKLRIITPAEGVVLTIYDQVVQGHVFSFSSRQFSLDDGTKVTWAFGRLSDDSQNAVTTVVNDGAEAEQARNDQQEIVNLRQQDRRQLVGVKEIMANGGLDVRVLVYQYELSDGRTKEIGEGGEVNNILTKEQRQEWAQRKDAGSGEDLGTHEEKVEGRLFVFRRQKLVLSDGTEVTWAHGTPNDKP